MPATDKLSKKMTDRFFKRVYGVVWDLQTGKVGIESPEGIVTLDGKGDDAEININMIEQFGIPIPAFAQSTPINSVKVGDLIYTGSKAKGWVVEVKEKAIGPDPDDSDDSDAVAIKKSFRVISPSGTVTTWNPPKVSLLGFESGVMVLKSLSNMLPGGTDGLANIQGMLMPMLMMGDGELGDMEDMLPMLLMTQTGALGESAGGNLMQTMLMMKMLGGGKKGGRMSDWFDR